MDPAWITVDGNEAAASVAHRAQRGDRHLPDHALLGDGRAGRRVVGRGPPQHLGHRCPQVIEMQSEGGAAGAVHGALQAGALATTFTASQGLLLMIPNMYKIAGELTPFCMHVAARDRGHARALDLRRPLRRDGLPADRLRACCAAGSVQEAQDFALHRPRRDAARPRAVPALLRRLPHLARGRQDRRRSTTTMLRAMLDDELIAAHRARALTPDHPVLRGTRAEPRHVLPGPRGLQPLLRRLPGHRAGGDGPRSPGSPAGATGCSSTTATRRPSACIVVMGSGAETAHETVDWLVARGEKVGVLKVRLYRPFSVARLLARAAHDRPGRSRCSTAPRSRARSASRSTWTCVTALARRARHGRIAPRARASIGGRYGLSSKEFTPAMVKAVFDELAQDRAAAATSPSASSTTSRHSLAASGTATSTSSRPTSSRARVLRPRRGRHGRREQELDQDHRRGDGPATPRATSSTTRRSRARSPSRTCASARGRSGRPT